MQDSFLFRFTLRAHTFIVPDWCKIVQDLFSSKLYSVLRSGILTRNGTGLYRIRFRNDFKGLKLGYIDPEWLHIVQDYFVSFYICMCTPELSRIGDIVQDCSIFFYYFWQPLSCIVKDLYFFPV